MPRIDPEDVPMVEHTGYPPPHDQAVRGRFYRRVSREVGLEDFAVNLITLKPGAWSSQRHWHPDQDEFAILLSGEAVLIDDGGRTAMRPGDCAAFPKDDGNGHHFVNESDADAVLLVVGALGGDQCRYPDIDLDIDPARGPGFLHKDGSPY